MTSVDELKEVILKGEVDLKKLPSSELCVLLGFSLLGYAKIQNEIYNLNKNATREWILIQTIYAVLTEKVTGRRVLDVSRIDGVQDDKKNPTV